LIAGVALLCLESAVVCTGGALLVPRLLRQAIPQPNARCPYCGHEFYVRYQKKTHHLYGLDMHECPRCGRDCLEMQLEVTAAEAERNEKNNKEIMKHLKKMEEDAWQKDMERLRNPKKEPPLFRPMH
jgi:hypothetical protein